MRFIQRLLNLNPIGNANWRLATLWPSETSDARQRSLMRILAVSLNERINPATLVWNLAAEHRGFYKRKLIRLARRLSEGTPLADALEQTPEVLNDERVLAIRFAYQNGTLKHTIKRLIDEPPVMPNQAQGLVRQNIGYTVVVAVFTGAVLSFLAIHISPVLVEIVHEFGLPPDVYESMWAFRLFLAVTIHVSHYGYLWAIGCVLITLFVFSRRGRRLARHLIARERTGVVGSLHSAQLLNLLADSLDEGRPLAGSLSTLARYHFDNRVRQRLLLARNEIEQGTDVWSSLADARLFTPSECLGLDTLSTNQSKAWAMRKLAVWKTQHVSQRMERMIAFIQPAMVLFFSGFVLLAGYALFQFFSQLQHGLAVPWLDN